MPPKLNQDMEPTTLVGEGRLGHLEEVVPSVFVEVREWSIDLSYLAEYEIHNIGWRLDAEASMENWP